MNPTEIDVEIRKQEEAAANVYDGPELQKHRVRTCFFHYDTMVVNNVFIV